MKHRKVKKRSGKLSKKRLDAIINSAKKSMGAAIKKALQADERALQKALRK